jgi:putative phosphoribosyl transferase
LPEVAGHDVILVDDGVATGITAEAALRALRIRHPRRLVLAVPVCPADSKKRLAEFADEVVCVAVPKRFVAVGAWYTDFHQVGDSEVAELLHRPTALPKVRW